MKKFLVITYLATFIMLLSGITTETASFRDFMYGSTEDTEYDNFFSRLVEGVARDNYNQYAPWNRQTTGFGNFVLPTAAQLNRWRTVVEHFMAEEFAEAEAAIEENEFPYDIVEFHDTDTDRTYYMLRERLNLDYFDDNGFPDNPEMHQRGSFDYGWGLYVVNPSSDVPVIVNVVHPQDDFISIPLATDAFQLWDARYFATTAAGREVLWTEDPPYFNSKSLSDPSRKEEHPFNVVYQAICDNIRERYDRRELSVQIHSFDYTHMGYKPVLVATTGPDQKFPGLPTRDLSGNFNDLINATPYVVFPANAIGMHDEIKVTDYYSVHYSDFGHYYNNDGELIPVCDDVHLAAYRSNLQMFYTLEDWNLYDTFSPFFHVELEELPSVYPQTMEIYKWFYGFNHHTETWDADNYFTRSNRLYRPWIEAFNEVLPAVLEFDDGVPPTTPTNLAVIDSSATTVKLEWTKSSGYDFESYEVYYSNEPIDEESDTFLDRDDLPILASQGLETLFISELMPETQYYFRVRARDYNGNYSDFSEEITRYPGEVRIENLRALGHDGFVELQWLVPVQYDNLGFNIRRSARGENNYSIIASWELYESLEGSNTPNIEYSFQDYSAVDGIAYDYKLSSVNIDNDEFFYHLTVPGAISRIYTINIANEEGDVTDFVEFGTNHFATDGYDPDYDILYSSSATIPYIRAMFFHSSWEPDLRRLERDLFGHFDPEEEFRTWVLMIETDQLDQPISVSIDDGFQAADGSLYLVDVQAGEITNLAENDYLYFAQQTNPRTFFLHWGRVLPKITFEPRDNRFFQGGENITFGWNNENAFIIDSIDLLLVNPTQSHTIEADLPGNTRSYQWNIPTDIDITNAELVVRTYLNHEEYLDFASPYRLGFVPEEIHFNNSAGWYLKSNPHVNYMILGSLYFGQMTQLYRYRYEQGDYLQTASFGYDRGHWVFLHDDFETYVGGDIQRGDFSQTIYQNWNLVPNPYYTDIPVKDLVFVKDNREYSYYEAIRELLINRAIYGVEDSRYIVLDQIKAGDSFWVYSNVEELSIKYRPFRQNNDYVPFAANWSLDLIARKGDYLIDKITVGHIPFGGEDYNYAFDLPKPLRRPGAVYQLYLEADDPTYPFTKLQSKFTRDLETEYSDALYWNFVLETTPSEEPVFFSVSHLNLPENSRAVLLSDELFIVLSEEEEYPLVLQNGTLSGQLMITNQEVTAIESVPAPSKLFSNYPNPFYASTQNERQIGTVIPFYLETPNRVRMEVYNIKGQRITTLIDDKISAGKHNVNWNGRDSYNRSVASGVYFYRMILENGESETRKMLLLK